MMCSEGTDNHMRNLPNWQTVISAKILSRQFFLDTSGFIRDIIAIFSSLGRVVRFNFPQAFAKWSLKRTRVSVKSEITSGFAARVKNDSAFLGNRQEVLGF
jgi:hypothetical protein